MKVISLLLLSVIFLAPGIFYNTAGAQTLNDSTPSQSQCTVSIKLPYIMGSSADFETRSFVKAAKYVAETLASFGCVEVSSFKLDAYYVNPMYSVKLEDTKLSLTRNHYRTDWVVRDRSGNELARSVFSTCNTKLGFDCASIVSRVHEMRVSVDLVAKALSDKN